jgi:ADP-ribosylglycohydrolase
MLRDRVRGCILGGVIGDAFGAPLEGATPSGIGPNYRTPLDYSVALVVHRR